MSVKLLTAHRLEFLNLKGGGTGSSESTLVKMPHCSKSHVTAQFFFEFQKCYLNSLECLPVTHFKYCAVELKLIQESVLELKNASFLHYKTY